MVEPCDKSKKPDGDREPLEMVEGDMPITEPDPVPEPPLAGAMVMPPPPRPETDMVDGEMEIMPPEPQPEPELEPGEMHARGNRQVLHFDE